MSAIGEFELIERYFRPLAGPSGLGLLDDAALLEPDHGMQWVVSTDMVVEGIDFFPDDPPEAIAAKALRVNLSDLAGKGAEPCAYLLALGLGNSWTEAWVAGFAAGLARDQGRYGVDLIGGDTGRSGERTTIAITALGKVPAGTLVRRAGAGVGDAIVVSGTIGDSALGLRLRQGKLSPPPGGSVAHLLHRYLYPEPRTALAPALRRYATSAMDVSDGLLADLAKLGAATGVGAEIEAGRVPLSSEAGALLRHDGGLVEAILTGGDDYEILCTVAEVDLDPFLAAGRAVGVACAPIGRTVAAAGPPLVTDLPGGGRGFAATGYDHFRRSPSGNAGS